MRTTHTTRIALMDAATEGPGRFLRFPPVRTSIASQFGRRVLVVALALLAWLAPTTPSAYAEPPVEHSGEATFIDPTFSAFLTQSCGFPVTVTDTESDTVLDNGTVFMLSIHITADVVGNGHQIMLRTNNPVIVNDQNNLTVGMIVQVRSATNRLLVQYGGQLRILDDGTTAFHPAFPQFNLCDYLR